MRRYDLGDRAWYPHLDTWTSFHVSYAAAMLIVSMPLKVATGDKLMQSLVVGAGAEVFSPDRIIEVRRIYWRRGSHNFVPKCKDGLDSMLM